MKVTPNNIQAYSLSGKFLWNIQTFIGDHCKEFVESVCEFGQMKVFDSDSILTSMEVQLVDPEEIIKGHEYLVCHNAFEMRIIIDITEDYLVQIKHGFK